jgi:hypothetical protein
MVRRLLYLLDDFYGLLVCSRASSLMYTQSLAIEGPYLYFALRGTSASTVHISTDTHFLYLKSITAFSSTVYASVECDNGIG